MPGEFLDRFGGGAMHREVRAERVAQDVNTTVCQVREARRPTNGLLHHYLRE